MKKVSQDKPATNDAPLKAQPQIGIYCRLSPTSEQPASSESSEWYELAEEVKSGAQPDAAVFIEGIAERKIAAITLEEIADIIESNNGQLMSCWR
jgi:hypothetical protein